MTFSHELLLPSSNLLPGWSDSVSVVCLIVDSILGLVPYCLLVSFLSSPSPTYLLILVLSIQSTTPAKVKRRLPSLRWAGPVPLLAFVIA